MTKEELDNALKDLHNGDLIRIEFLSHKDARGAMEGRFMHTYDGKGALPDEEQQEHTYLHFTDGVRVFDIHPVYAQLIKSITVLEHWVTIEN